MKRFSSLNFLLRVEAEGDWYGCIHGPLRFALAKTGGRRGVEGTGHDRFILNGASASSIQQSKRATRLHVTIDKPDLEVGVRKKGTPVRDRPMLADHI